MAVDCILLYSGGRNQAFVFCDRKYEFKKNHTRLTLVLPHEQPLMWGDGGCVFDEGLESVSDRF